MAVTPDYNTDPTTMTAVDQILVNFAGQNYLDAVHGLRTLRGSQRIMAAAKLSQDALAGKKTQQTFISWVMSQLDDHTTEAETILAAFNAGNFDTAWVALNALPGAVPLAVMQEAVVTLSTDDANAFFNWVQRI